MDDLQHSLTIFENCVNEHRPFTATDKIFITVFHTPADKDVVCNGDSEFIDGRNCELQVHGRTLWAVQHFKHVGVGLDS
eukprot:12404145-Karenia_brevis.AAC.1